MRRPDAADIKAAMESIGDSLMEGAGTAKDHLAGAASAAYDRAAAVAKRRDVPADLAAMPTEAKLVYCQTLAAHARGDGVLDAREIANVYLFASTIGLDAEGRRQVREALAAERADATSPAGGAEVLELARGIPPLLETDDRQPVMSALVRDLLRVSRADGKTSEDERVRVMRVAELVFDDDAPAAVDMMDRQLDTDDKYLAGRITEAEWKKRTKDAVANGAAIGVPIMAISAAGSVSGLGAAGITSGLAWLGFGGLLGLSPMVTGIGTVVIIGVVVHKGVRFALGTGQREQERRREKLIQEILQHHQQAITDLTEDIAGIARQLDEYMAATDRNEERLTRLRADLSSFEAALGDLQASRDRFEQAVE